MPSVSMHSFEGRLYRAALSLYQKMGFAPTGQTETFIHPLTDEDHVRLAKLG